MKRLRFTNTSLGVVPVQRGVGAYYLHVHESCHKNGSLLNDRQVRTNSPRRDECK